MVELRVERVHGPARRALSKGLRAYNVAATGRSDSAPLTLTVREGSKIVGGLAAETYYGWMFVSLLWVDDKHRGKGIGSSLIERAEAEARARGVTDVWLDTFEFQAEGFYRKLGYRRFGHLDDFPPGFSRIWLTKRLEGAVRKPRR
jgi:GNAT superfamily N-acetyltransferase